MPSSLDRRSALSTFAVGGAAGLAAGTAASPRPAAALGAPSLPASIFGPRMNFAQAEKIMSELGLDAIVVGDGTNLMHAAGLDLTATRMGHTPGVYAIISRHADRRLSLVAPAFLFYYTIAMDYRDYDYPVYLFTSAMDGAPGADGEPKAGPLALYPDSGIAPLDDIESARAEVVERVAAQEAARPSLMYAVRKALKDLGVDKGRIAADLPPVIETVSKAAPDATVVMADDALRRIRPVKSAVEIELMRYAAQANAEAALLAARAAEPGMGVRDLRALYFAEVALRGLRPVFMVVNRVSSPTYEDELRNGQCFSIDCVSEYMGYHGDFARAVHIGDPPESMKHVSEGTGRAWDALREQIRPGLRFSEVRAMGKKALKDLGYDFPISFTPHSVGLYHADHVGNMGLPPREDIALEPGMVLSVDCPLGAVGHAGSSHLEDLMLITADGAEPINDIGSKVVVV